MVWIHFLPREIPYAVGAAKKEKKKRVAMESAVLEIFDRYVTRTHRLNWRVDLSMQVLLLFFILLFLFSSSLCGLTLVKTQMI